MKATALFVSIMALCLLVIPMIALNFDTERETAKETQTLKTAEKPYFSPVESSRMIATDDEELVDGYVPEEDYGDTYAGEDTPVPAASNRVESFLILDEGTGLVNEVPVRDFVRGAVAAEMPASFHSEALKAQAVAAHTFALHNHLARQSNPNPAHKGADFSADPGSMKVYITEETAREFYGDNADLYWNKICKAADSVVDYVLEYDDEPIVAAYHAISSGMTEDASNVWIGSAPYLLAVPSEGDLLAPGYETKVSLTPDEVRSKLEAEYPGIELGGDASAWFGEAVRSDSGYVTSMDVGGVELHGKDIRELFDLRSHNFEVGYSGGEFTFTVTGYGHGVGLSQYGADFLARQGCRFEEILSTYYTGTVLKTTAVD